MKKERYWTFILYPESAPLNWKEILQETGLQIAISPLHNEDMNPDGTPKKEHYHIFLMFNGPTTYNRVEEITKEVNATIPKRVMSPIGMIRYLTHEDNPEKAQYNKEDITTLNGLDIGDINALTCTKIESIKRELLEIINNFNIIEYSDLIDYLRGSDYREGLEVASNKTYFFSTYISSRRFKENNK